LVGVLPVGIANLAWDVGARHGDPLLLAGLSFLEPVASTALIALILSQPVRLTDYAAMILVILAVACSILSERLRRKRSTPLPAG
jgi:drug/metabolite transporter (DMT)-like permease